MKMLIAVLRYIPLALFVLAMKFLTWIFACVIALFVRWEEESVVTGYPPEMSKNPGKIKAHIIPLLWNFSTFDAAADHHWYSGRTRRFSLFGWQPFKDMSDERYEQLPLVQYIARVFWLYRNPAYGFARMVGFDQSGVVINGTEFQNIKTVRDQKYLWDTGYNNWSLWTTENNKGQAAFRFELQYHWFGTPWCTELLLGYKVPWDNDPTNKAMLSVRILPLKRYPKVEPKPTPSAKL